MITLRLHQKNPILQYIKTTCQYLFFKNMHWIWQTQWTTVCLKTWLNSFQGQTSSTPFTLPGTLRSDQNNFPMHVTGSFPLLVFCVSTLLAMTFRCFPAKLHTPLKLFNSHVIQKLAERNLVKGFTPVHPGLQVLPGSCTGPHFDTVSCWFPLPFPYF